MKTTHTITGALLLATALVAGCDKKDNAPAQASATAKADSPKPSAAAVTAPKASDAPVAKTEEKPAAKTEEKPAAKPEEKTAAATDTAAAGDYKGPVPSDDKDFLGLNLPAMGAWKPKWDPDAKVAKWENEEFMSSIVIRIVKDKLDSIDDLKSAAPMMMQLGTAITKVVEEHKTAKGWYAIVERDKQTDLIYVRKFGKTTVCSGNLTKEELGSSLTKELVIKACESYSPKA